MTRKERYDPTHTLTYGYWHCEACGSIFYGGGEALHNRGCPEQGYANCTYVFGPNEHRASEEMRAMMERERTV